MNAIEKRLRSYGPGALLAVALVVLGFFYPQVRRVAAATFR